MVEKQKAKTEQRKEEHHKEEASGLEIKFKKKHLIYAAILVVIIAAVYIYLHWPKTADVGDTAYINYVGKLTNGKVFDTNIESVARAAGIYNPQLSYQPLKFVVGGGTLIRGLEDAVYGMTEGQSKTATITPDLAYGKYDPSNVVEVNLSTIKNINVSQLTVGTQLTEKNGRRYTIVSVTNSTMTLDGNPPLAGQTLIFDITLVSVQKQ